LTPSTVHQAALIPARPWRPLPPTQHSISGTRAPSHAGAVSDIVANEVRRVVLASRQAVRASGINRLGGHRACVIKFGRLVMGNDSVYGRQVGQEAIAKSSNFRSIGPVVDVSWFVSF
jgi:hypothetical protein